MPDNPYFKLESMTNEAIPVQKDANENTVSNSEDSSSS